jgi:hypothetical protein
MEKIDIEDIVKSIKSGKNEGSYKINEHKHILSELLNFIDTELQLELSQDSNILKMLVNEYGSKTLKST